MAGDTGMCRLEVLTLLAMRADYSGGAINREITAILLEE